MTVKSFFQEKFFTGWSWIATAWGLCVAAWTVALIARMMVGPVACVRLIWYGGLDGAVIILTFLATRHSVIGLVHGLRSARQPSRSPTHQEDSTTPP